MMAFDMHYSIRQKSLKNTDLGEAKYRIFDIVVYCLFLLVYQ